MLDGSIELISMLEQVTCTYTKNPRRLIQNHNLLDHGPPQDGVASGADSVYTKQKDTSYMTDCKIYL